jgi:hypothetical protein
MFNQRSSRALLGVSVVTASAVAAALLPNASAVSTSSPGPVTVQV